MKIFIKVKVFNKSTVNSKIFYCPGAVLLQDMMRLQDVAFNFKMHYKRWIIFIEI